MPSFWTPKRDKDGAQLVNFKLGTDDRKRQDIFFTFKTGAAFVHYKNHLGQDLSAQLTQKFWNADQSAEVAPASAVITTLWLDPPVDYEILQGAFWCKTKPVAPFYVWGSLAPTLGGHCYLMGPDMSFIPAGTPIDVAGQSSTLVPIVEGPPTPTNRIEIKVEHAAGEVVETMVRLVWFVA